MSGKQVGECSYLELRDTTLDPRKRILTRISIEDAEEAAQTFEILMGRDAAARKNFIEENAFMADLTHL